MRWVLIIFLTPVMLTAAGNRLHDEDDLERLTTLGGKQ